MARAHFIQLASLEERGVITICRHGIVHLSWRNMTIRYRVHDFRRLARLLEQGGALASPIPLYDDELCVAVEEADYRVTMGAVELLLNTEEFLAKTDMALEAVLRLDQLLASDEWREEEAEPFPLTPWEESESPRFSLN